jgi:hypothetical protein
MLSSMCAVFVRPSCAVTVIIPWLTSNRPDMRFPSASWKLIVSLIDARSSASLLAAIRRASSRVPGNADRGSPLRSLTTKWAATKDRP